jgi:hypothetical protein
LSNIPTEGESKKPDESNLLFKDHDLPFESSNLPFDNDADIDESSTLTKKICVVIQDHQLHFLAEKTDPAWCKPNAMFHEVICQECDNVFVHKIIDPKKNVKPSVKRPMHVCMNEKLRCTYAVCHACYDKGMKKLLSDKKEEDDVNEMVANDLDEQPANDLNEQPANDNEQPANDNEQPANDSEQPADDNEQPANKNEQPANDNEQPADDNEQPAINDNEQPEKENNEIAVTEDIEEQEPNDADKQNQDEKENHESTDEAIIE